VKLQRMYLVQYFNHLNRSYNPHFKLLFIDKASQILSSMIKRNGFAVEVMKFELVSVDRTARLKIKIHLQLSIIILPPFIIPFAVVPRT